MASSQDISYVDLTISPSQHRRLRCVNRNCRYGDDLRHAIEPVCSYYDVDYKWYKEVCSHCYDQCFLYYEQLERKRLSGQCSLKNKFPNFASYQYIEPSSSSATSSLSSSDNDEESRPSIFTHVPKQTEPKSAIKSIDKALVGECFDVNKSNIDKHVPLCHEYMSEVEKSYYTGNIVKLSSDVDRQVSELKKEINKPFDSTFEFLPHLDLTESTFKRARDDLEYKQNKKFKFDIDESKDEEDNCEFYYIQKVYPLPDVLPKIGPQNYPPLKDGDSVFVLKSSLSQPWCKGKIKSVIYGNYMHIKCGSGEKLLTKKEVAYPTQNPVQFIVGARVIANCNNTPDTINSEIFFAGVIGERPSLTNKFRYLIFFDTGFVEYRYHKDIRLIVHQSDHVWNEVHHKLKEFIQSYLEIYPERQMVKLIKHHTVRVKHENHWKTAEVVEVDASIAKLYFPDIKNYEWIYRGSSRFWENYTKGVDPEKCTQLRQSGRAYLNKPFTEYTSVEESESRSVARKRTSKSSTKQCADEDLCKTLTLMLSKVRPQPKNFIAHDCDYSCVEWTAYDYSKTKKISMLAIPLYYGFDRSLVHLNRTHKFVVYKTPCGRLITNTKEMFGYLNRTRSKMTIDQFDFSSWVNVLSEFRVLKFKRFLNDISVGKEFRGITCVNSINHKLPPPIVYTDSRRPMPGIHINVDSDFLCGCDCTDNCQDKTKCACWQLTIEGQKTLTDLYSDPKYIGYDYRRLSERVPTGIYECNKTCKCSSSCLNRVVQFPLSQKLQIFFTEKKGWGVRCLNDVPQGSFLCTYVGDLLTETDATERGLNYGDEYLAELNFIEIVEKIKEDYESDVPERISESSVEDYRNTSGVKKTTGVPSRSRKRKKPKNGTKTKKRKKHSVSQLNAYNMKIHSNPSKSVRKYFGDDESAYIMDAKTSGNIGRYLNHSCSPNAFVQNVFVDTHDLRFPWISFFALHYIPAGTELTWDYNYEVGSVPGKTMKCRCESVHCRGRLL